MASAGGGVLPPWGQTPGPWQLPAGASWDAGPTSLRSAKGWGLRTRPRPQEEGLTVGTLMGALRGPSSPLTPTQRASSLRVSDPGPVPLPRRPSPSGPLRGGQWAGAQRQVLLAPPDRVAAGPRPAPLARSPRGHPAARRRCHPADRAPLLSRPHCRPACGSSEGETLFLEGDQVPGAYPPPVDRCARQVRPAGGHGHGRCRPGLEPGAPEGRPSARGCEAQPLPPRVPPKEGTGPPPPRAAAADPQPPPGPQMVPHHLDAP